MRPNKWFLDCHHRFPGRVAQSFLKRPMLTLTVLLTDWRGLSKLSLESSLFYRFVIKIDNRVNRNSLFPDECNFLHLLKGSELNFILHWKAYSLIFSRSWLRSFVEVSMSWTTENKDVSPANSFHLLLLSFDKSLIYIKK